MFTFSNKIVLAALLSPIFALSMGWITVAVVVFTGNFSRFSMIVLLVDGVAAALISGYCISLALEFYGRYIHPVDGPAIQDPQGGSAQFCETAAKANRIRAHSADSQPGGSFQASQIRNSEDARLAVDRIHALLRIRTIE